MPPLEVHEFIDRVHLGKAYPKLHRYLDRPVFYLGKGHRVLFHDLPTAYYIASKLYPSDEKALTSAELHIHYDGICTADPGYRKFLEKLAKLDKQKRKESKRKRKKRKPTKKKEEDLDSLIRFLEFLLRLKSMRF